MANHCTHPTRDKYLLTDDALAPSAPPPALEIESLEMSDPESAPYPQMSETEIETELQNFDS